MADKPRKVLAYDDTGSSAVAVADSPKAEGQPRKVVPLDGLSLIKSPSPRYDLQGPDLTPQGQHGVLAEGANLASGAFPLIGGALGAVGGPGGAAVGAGTGAVVRDLVQSNMQGQPTPSFGQQALSFGTNAALAGVGGEVSSLAEGAFGSGIQGRLAAALANSVIGQGAKSTENIFSDQKSDTSAAALGKDALANLGFDIIGGKLVKTAVSHLTPEGRSSQPRTITLGEGMGQIREQARIGEGPVQPEGVPSKNRVELGTEGRKSIKENMKGVIQLERTQRKAFDDLHVKNNIVDIPQKGAEVDTGLKDAQGNSITRNEPKVATIEGPIYTNEATLKAVQFAPTISKFINGAEFESLTPYQQKRFKELDDNITKLITGTPKLNPGGTETSIPVLNYKTAKEMKTIISQTAGAKVSKTLAEGGLTELAKALDKDIDSSVANWKGGQSALQLLNEANATSKFKKDVFNKEILTRLHGKNSVTGQTDPRVEGDASQMFKKAYTSPEAAERMMNALGEENHGVLKQDYIDNQLTSKMHTKGKFTPENIINELEDPNSVSRTILSAPERNGMLRLMRAAKNSNVDGAGLKFHENMISIGVGKGAYLLGLKGGPGVAQAAQGAARIGTAEFFHSLQEKPELAEWASRLVKIPSNSTEGEILTKKLLRGLRGATVTVDVNGKEKEGELTETGKVKFF